LKCIQFVEFVRLGVCVKPCPILLHKAFVTLQLMLPSSFSIDDIRQLLEQVDKELKRDAVILCDVIVTGRRFVESCLDCFDELVKEKSATVSDPEFWFRIDEAELGGCAS